MKCERRAVYRGFSSSATRASLHSIPTALARIIPSTPLNPLKRHIVRCFWFVRMRKSNNRNPIHFPFINNSFVLNRRGTKTRILSCSAHIWSVYLNCELRRHSVFRFVWCRVNDWSGKAIEYAAMPAKIASQLVIFIGYRSVFGWLALGEDRRCLSSIHTNNGVMTIDRFIKIAVNGILDMKSTNWKQYNDRTVCILRPEAYTLTRTQMTWLLAPILCHEIPMI